MNVCHPNILAILICAVYLVLSIDTCGILSTSYQPALFLIRAHASFTVWNSGVLNETKCLCHRVPIQWYPDENIPEDIWSKPKPRAIASLKAYDELE